MIIDIHSHIVERSYLSDLVNDAGLRTQVSDTGQTFYRKEGHTVAWSRESMFDIDARLRDMDAKGIDQRVLSLSTPNVYEWRGARQVQAARTINDAVAKLCRAHPDRFCGLGSLPLDDIDASLAEIDRVMDELGMRGVVIGSNIAGQPLNHERFEPIWARLDELRLPVFEHPMFPANTSDLEQFELPLRVGFAYDTTTAAARLIYGGVFRRYPNFPYIMAHTGGTLLMLLERLDNGYRLFPDCREFIDELPSVYAKKLYYDSCAFSAPALMMAHSIVGADHILWGSDDPFIGADTAHVASLPISTADKSAILGGNAARILGLRQG